MIKGAGLKETPGLALKTGFLRNFAYRLAVSLRLSQRLHMSVGMSEKILKIHISSECGLRAFPLSDGKCTAEGVCCTVQSIKVRSFVVSVLFTRARPEGSFNTNKDLI